MIEYWLADARAVGLLTDLDLAKSNSAKTWKITVTVVGIGREVAVTSWAVAYSVVTVRLICNAALLLKTYVSTPGLYRREATGEDLLRHDDGTPNMLQVGEMTCSVEAAGLSRPGPSPSGRALNGDMQYTREFKAKKLTPANGIALRIWEGEVSVFEV